MADITNIGDPSKLASLFRELDEAHLIAQEITQQGAIHAISALLAAGCTESNAAAMLRCLRQGASAIRDECRRRGANPLFETDRTGFQ